MGLLLFMAGCTANQPEDPVVVDPTLSPQLQQLQSRLAAFPTASPLSAAEKTSLLFMREEEKLARDLYRQFYQAWGITAFDHIQGSEQTHMDAVWLLLQRYQLDDPTSAQIGVFANADLQALYNQLLQQGMQSAIEALRVGALVEEVDIRDLQEQAADIDNADILFIYDNLELGSRNHLRAFNTNLTNRGITYEPQILSPAEYAAIINSPKENGGF